MKEDSMENISDDCMIEKHGYWFRFRAGGLLIRDGKALFVKSRYGEYYYVPGGGVHLGEDSRDCAEREIFEETGIKCTASRLAITCENFFYGTGGDQMGKECHILEYYYIMDIPEGAQFDEVNDESELLAWLPVRTLNQYDVRPAFLKQYVGYAADGGQLVHIINDER